MKLAALSEGDVRRGARSAPWGVTRSASLVSLSTYVAADVTKLKYFDFFMAKGDAGTSLLTLAASFQTDFKSDRRCPGPGPTWAGGSIRQPRTFLNWRAASVPDSIRAS